MSLRGPRTTALYLFALAAVALMPGLTRAQMTSAPQDNLNARYANGIAAIAEDQIITVDDIRREIGPLIAGIQQSSHNEKEFYEKLEALQEDVVQSLIDRVLMVKEFYKDEKRKVPASYVDNAVAENIITQFDGDRSKFLAYLRARGISQKDYRREQEEDMIYHYMRQQQSKSASTVSPVKIEQFYNENKERFYQEDSARLRLLKLNRTPGESDDTLRTRAQGIVDQFHAGTAFENLARQYSQDSSKSKGGDMGWQRKPDVVKQFSDAIFELKKGEATAPILTPDAAYVFYAEDRKYAGTLPIDEVRPEIERMLVQQSSQHATERWLEKLRRNAYVKHF